MTNPVSDTVGDAQIDQRFVPRPELKALTSLRFFLATWVVYFHAAVPSDPFYLGRLTVIPYLGIINNGGLAVSSFFCLSGFILAYNYHDRLSTAQERKFFLVARFARIYPVYLAACLAWIPVGINWIIIERTTPLNTAPSLVLSLVLLQAWIPSMALIWNAPAWSLSAEAFFYISLPLLLPAANRLKSTAIAALLISFAAIAIALPHFSAILPIFRLPEFLAGALAGLLFVRHGSFFGELSPILLILSSVLILVVASQPSARIWSEGILTVPFIVLIYCLTKPPLWMNLFEHPALCFLGESSYSLYLLHLPVLFVLDFGLKLLTIHPFLKFSVYFLVALAVAAASYIFIECPARRALISKYKHSQQMAMAS